jgi:protein TonB
LTDEADAKHTISLDDRRPQYLDYLGRLKQRIQREWAYPLEAQRLGLFGELLLVFTVNKEGSLLNLRLVQSSGFPILDNEALRAVRAAAPFDPIPPEMGTEAWNIRGAFNYLGPPRFR